MRRGGLTSRQGAGRGMTVSCQAGTGAPALPLQAGQPRHRAEDTNHITVVEMNTYKAKVDDCFIYPLSLSSATMNLVLSLLSSTSTSSRSLP